MLALYVAGWADAGRLVPKLELMSHRLLCSCKQCAEAKSLIALYPDEPIDPEYLNPGSSGLACKQISIDFQRLTCCSRGSYLLTTFVVQKA